MAVIVVEERLRTRTLSFTIAAIAVVVALVEIFVLSRASTHAPRFVDVLVAVVLVGLIFVYVAFTSIIVRVLDGAEGRTLEVLYGPGPVFRQRFGPRDIVDANAQQMSLTRMGGWGYRGSLTIFRHATLSTRRGNALVVNLSGARRFVVTVDEPEAFAAALVSSELDKS